MTSASTLLSHISSEFLADTERVKSAVERDQQKGNFQLGLSNYTFTTVRVIRFANLPRKYRQRSRKMFVAPKFSWPQPSAERVASYWRQDDSALSKKLGAIIAATPSLQEPTYRPTPWARSSTANFALATLRSRLGALRRSMEPPFLGRISETSDPDLHVEWAKDPVAALLPDDAPIVIILHTITGSAAQTRWLMKYASQRGWRSCVFVRRGHGGPLHVPSFNLLGAVDDVQLQLEAVERAYPRAGFRAMVGVSAGSAQLISYLGRAGASTPVGAACVICPAWDVQTAFASMSISQPLAERVMVTITSDDL